jgi:hypothetical protein
MSVCDEGWGEAINYQCPVIDDYLMGEMSEFSCHFRPELKDYPDSCPFAPILRALPGASEKKLRFITKFLTEMSNEGFEEVKAHKWFYYFSSEVTESE